MVGLFGRISAPGGQRFGGTGMAGKTPATAHRFVDRAPHEGMTEDESPRHLGRPDEVSVEQIVEGGQGLGLAQLTYRGREVQLEGLTGHGRRVQQCARWIGEGLELPRDGSGYGRGHPGGIRIRVERGRERLVVADAAELLEVERIAAPVPVDRGDGLGLHPVEQQGRFRFAQLSELEPVHPRVGQRRPQALGGLTGAEPESKQDRRVGLATGESSDQLE